MQQVHKETVTCIKSARKDSVTLCVCGCTVSPPIAAIYLRGGWSMRTVKDCYLHDGKTSDQYVDQTVADISAQTIEIAVS